jgi:outer membrane protein OmpA-like peptidoglycan-associated protein
MEIIYKTILTSLLWLAITVFLNPISIFGQEQPGLRERADRFYYEYQYSKAIPIYLKLADSKKPRLSDLERLAESYAKMNRYGEAENWYSRVVQAPSSRPESLLSYAGVLKQNSRYTEAKKVLQEYAEKTGDQLSVANEIAGCDSALVWMANPTAHKIKNQSGVNTGKSEFSVFSINGKIHYVGEPELSMDNRSYGWTGNPYLRIYTADGGAGNDLNSPLISEEQYNDKNYHVGPVSSDAAGNTLYITRTYPGKEAELSKENKRKYRTNKLELFIYEKDDNGNWIEVPFAYNNVKEYSVGHASTSMDGNILYFASDMPGGQGGTDIWYSVKQSDGTWGTPENAGAEINTDKDELFPNIAPDGTIYFSSNGLPGMGGLDIFSSTGSKSQWTKAVNLKYPVNSAGDDFGFISTEITDNGMAGYLSSNRIAGKGDDDIYSFNYAKAKIILVLKGTTYNKNTNEILPETSVTLFSGGREIIGKQSTKGDGVFIFELDEDSDYKVLGQKTSYHNESAIVSTKGITKSDTLYANLYLEPLFEVGKRFLLENIHYDFDKSNIRKDAVEILDKLVRVMRDNPTLKIELSSHTDSRGLDSYNETLSQRRAQSVVDYLVSQGINRSRMVAQGYGERRLLNRCANEVACSEAEHQENRRTEVEILAF